jgi:hypothetical protein
MKGFFDKISPVGAVGDVIAYIRAPRPHRWGFFGLSAAATFAVFSLITSEKYAGLPKLPEITYFPSFLPGRSDAQIRRENIEATKKARAEEAREEAEDAQIRANYKAMGDALNMDTRKAIERGNAERAEAKRRYDAFNAEILRKHLVK